MDLLQVRGNRITEQSGKPVRLRGTCIGGWMNMENFINGYTGAEHSLRAAMAQELGDTKAEFFFDRMLDYFFNEYDVAFIKSLDANVVRLPLNYRHFEDDAKPFQYLEKGFRRLDEALKWCEKYGVYAILDLHSAQGSQNPDWHSDNSNRQSNFWQHPHFQDRFVALWEELARRYQGNTTVAGYDILNEPICNILDGRFNNAYITNWERINQLYRRTVNAIRKIDPDHIIFLEGDYLSTRFLGLEAPFAENLVYSSHNYVEALQFSNAYPGINDGVYWNRARQEQQFLQTEAVQFTQNHQVPLWVGEFSPVFLGNEAYLPNRYRALNDQIDIIDTLGNHWTTWTYKDVGVMSWVYLNPESEYMQLIRLFLKHKEDLGTDYWFTGLPITKPKQLMKDLSSCVVEMLNDPDIDLKTTTMYLQQATASVFLGQLMQPQYAKLFKGMSENQLDSVLQSFSIKNCVKHQGVIEAVRQHTARPA